MHKFSSRILSLYLLIISVILYFFCSINSVANIYTDHIYPYINLIIGTITAPIPFAIGEIIMYLGAVSLILFIIFSILYIFLHKKNSYKKLYQAYSDYVILFACVMIFLYTITWIIPFKADVLKISSTNKKTFSATEVASVRAYYVNLLNESLLEIPRDENNKIIYSDYRDDVIDAMRSISNEFPRLRGHYSYYKPALCSDFLEWMSIGGYNYPYTMEPTLNIYCDKLYTPTLYAHELSHHKGYYKENEADFLSYIALSRSTNPLLRVSACESAYYYLDEAYLDALNTAFSEITDDNARNKQILEVYSKEPQLDDLYFSDKEAFVEEANDFYNENVNETAKENFSEISEEIAQTGWEVQAGVLGENIYSGVTLMLLQYHCP